MTTLKTGGYFAASISILFLFLVFSSTANAQSSSSLHDIYSPELYYPDFYSPGINDASIYTPKADQSNIYTLNQDLIDFHHPSLYESIHSNEGNNSLIIVLDKKGNVLSVIRLNNNESEEQPQNQDKPDIK